MRHPVEIVLRGIPSSAALQRCIGEEKRKLDAICGGIRSCQVVAEVLRRENEQAAQFAVRLIIALPGTEVVVNREHADDVFIAVRDAFAAVGLQLKDQMRRLGEADRGAAEATPGPGN